MVLKKRRTQKNKINRRKQQSKRGGKRTRKNRKNNVRNKRQSRRRMRGGSSTYMNPTYHKDKQIIMFKNIVKPLIKPLVETNTDNNALKKKMIDRGIISKVDLGEDGMNEVIKRAREEVLKEIEEERNGKKRWRLWG
jgi:hypothetical protein